MEVTYNDTKIKSPHPQNSCSNNISAPSNCSHGDHSVKVKGKCKGHKFKEELKDNRMHTQFLYGLFSNRHLKP